MSEDIIDGEFEDQVISSEEEESDSSSNFDTSEFSEEYAKVNAKEELVDIESGNVIDKEKLTTLDYIKAISKKMGIELVDPDPSCKFCLGRGHTNFIEKPKSSEDLIPKNRAERRRLEKENLKNNKEATKELNVPIPCKCIYKNKEDFNAENKMPRLTNRSQRRKLESASKKQSDKIIDRYRKTLKNKGQEEFKEKVKEEDGNSRY